MPKLPVARVVRDSDRGATNDAGGAADGSVLRLAPRPLPRALVWKLLFGGGLTPYAWLFTAIGLAIVCATLPAIDLSFATYDRYADATVTSVEESGRSDNGKLITYRVRYTFRDDAGIEHRDESYTRSRPELGNWLAEYPSGRPSHSRLSGMQRGEASPVALFAILFAVFGFGLAAWRLPEARRNLRTLRHGVETRGRLVRRSETGIVVETPTLGEKPLVELTFEYEAQGKMYAITVETLHPERLEDDEREPMLYDPWAPERATPLDHLPGSPKVTASGELDVRPGIAIHLLVAPIASAVLLVATVVRMLV